MPDPHHPGATAAGGRPSAAIVLAAGQGTRMRSARPKVLHPIGGRSLLAHAVHAVAELEPEHLVVVVGHGGDEVGAALTELGAQLGRPVRAAVQLAGLQPEDVTVQAVVGRVGETDDLADTVTVAMQHVGEADGDGDRFESVVKLPHAGLTGYTVRVLPSYPLLASAAELGKVVLAG